MIYNIKLIKITTMFIKILLKFNLISIYEIKFSRLSKFTFQICVMYLPQTIELIHAYY